MAFVVVSSMVVWASVAFGVSAAATPPQDAKEAAADPALERVKAMPIVPAPLDEATLRNCMRAVGLRSRGGDAAKAVDAAIVKAFEAAKEQRAAFDGGALVVAQKSIAQQVGASGGFNAAALNTVAQARRSASEIDLQVVSLVASAMEDAKDASRTRLVDALRQMLRIDAAMSTMERMPLVPVSFISVGPGLQTVNLSTDRGVLTRDLLIADLERRAEAAEGLSLASLEVSTTDAQSLNSTIQMSLTSLLAQGVAVDPELLRVLSSLMLSRPAVKPAAALAKLDADLAQALATALTPMEAADVLIALDPRAMRRGVGALDIRRLCAESTLLKGVTTEQATKIESILESWQKAQLAAYQGVLEVDARWLRDTQPLAERLKVDDPSSWQMNPPSPALQQVAKEMTQRREQSKAAKDASERAQDQLKETLGEELWLQLVPEEAKPA
ncbi:MAG: hypothetical protein EBR10_07680 [Planctomycetes bacterium]|nr:hypothetical protein [Planctomycetota bacterium]